MASAAHPAATPQTPTSCLDNNAAASSPRTNAESTAVDNTPVYCLLFHYRHRREQRQGTVLQTCCAIIKLSPASFERLVKDYGKLRWSDELEKVEDDGMVVLEKVAKEALPDINLPELGPPKGLPQGNVGTPMPLLKELIRTSVLPTSVLRKLKLDFVATKRRKFGRVPPPPVLQPRHRVPVREDGETAAKYQLCTTVAGASGADKQPSNTVPSHLGANEAKKRLQRKLRRIAGLHGRTHNIGRSAGEHLIDAAVEAQPSFHEDDDGDNDDVLDRDMEEWDRHMALNPTALDERDKEKLYEKDVSNPWDKGQADGLVWHTDAFYWNKMKGDFEEETADGFDVDVSEHFGYGPGDRAAQQMREMRQQGYAPALGSWGRRYDIDGGSKSHAEVDHYQQGVGARILRAQGWRKGEGVGHRPGRSSPVPAEGQGPRERFGLGFRPTRDDIAQRQRRKVPRATRDGISASLARAANDEARIEIGSIYDHKPKH